jgi:hypothetical protein
MWDELIEILEKLEPCDEAGKLICRFYDDEKTFEQLVEAMRALADGASYEVSEAIQKPTSEARTRPPK